MKSWLLKIWYHFYFMIGMPSVSVKVQWNNPWKAYCFWLSRWRNCDVCGRHFHTNSEGTQLSGAGISCCNCEHSELWRRKDDPQAERP